MWEQSDLDLHCLSKRLQIFQQKKAFFGDEGFEG